MPSTRKLEQEKMRARQLLQAGQLDAAKNLFLSQCKAVPNDVESWFSLGDIHRRLGHFSEAQTCLQEAICLAPDKAVVHQALGVLSIQTRQFELARACFQHVIELQPHSVDAWYLLANAEQGLSNFTAAEDAFRQVLTRVPEHKLATAGLATCLRLSGQFDAAIPLFLEALELEPDNVNLVLDLSDAYVDKGTYDLAIDLLSELFRRHADDFQVAQALGSVLLLSGHYEKALTALECASSLRPEDAGVIALTAGALSMLSRFDQAWEQIEPLVIQGEPRIMQSYFDVSAHVGRREHAVQSLEKVLAQADISDALRDQLHVCLARHYEAETDFSAAWTHYSTAASLRRKSFDVNAFRAQVTAIIETYTAGYVQTMPRSDCASAQPVFILGMPRSGTSLTEQILATHTDVCGAGELPHIYDLAHWAAARLTAGKAFPALASEMSGNMANRMAAHYLDSTAKLAAKALRVTDKMPINFLYLGFIAQLFPRAIIIHCLRNPLDTCLSCFFSPLSTVGHAYSDDLRILGEYYMEYRRLMAHWSQVLDLPLLETEYEALVTDQETVTRKLLDFCGLDWDPACLDFHQSGRTVSTLSNQQVRERIYTRSVGRWKNYEPYLDALREPLEKAGLPGIR